MNYTINDILLMDNFDNISKKDMIEIIHALKYDLKYYKFQRDTYQDTLTNTINGLKIEIQNLNTQIETLNKYNGNLSKKIFKPLTLMERIKGKIDINK